MARTRPTRPYTALSRWVSRPNKRAMHFARLILVMVCELIAPWSYSSAKCRTPSLLVYTFSQPYCFTPFTFALLFYLRFLLCWVFEKPVFTILRIKQGVWDPFFMFFYSSFSPVNVSSTRLSEWPLEIPIVEFAHPIFTTRAAPRLQTARRTR